MIEMKSIEMYECQHCKKLFRTPDRHNCRRDPDYTNCYSCEHWGHEFKQYDAYEGDYYFLTSCNIKSTYADEAFDTMHENRWSMNCPDYKRKT